VAAQRNGLTQSREVERRLEASLANERTFDETLALHFGARTGDTVINVFGAIIEAANVVAHIRTLKETWADAGETHQALAVVLHYFLEASCPEADPGSAGIDVLLLRRELARRLDDAWLAERRLKQGDCAWLERGVAALRRQVKQDPTVQIISNPMPVESQSGGDDE
jgi:hypothetical protein